MPAVAAPTFYQELGRQVTQQPDDEVCFFQAGGMVFGLWAAPGGHGAPGVEQAHNVGSAAEVESVIAEAERAGGRVVRTPERAVWGGFTGASAEGGVRAPRAGDPTRGRCPP